MEKTNESSEMRSKMRATLKEVNLRLMKNNTTHFTPSERSHWTIRNSILFFDVRRKAQNRIILSIGTAAKKQFQACLVLGRFNCHKTLNFWILWQF